MTGGGIHLDLIFADETGSMVVSTDLKTGEILDIGVDIVREREGRHERVV